MKILLVNYEYKGQGGGAGQQMYYLAKALRDFGHEVTLLIGWDNKLGEPKLLDGVTTHAVKNKRRNIQLSTPSGMLFFVIRGLFCINKLTKKHRYDIIQFYFSVPTGILKFGIHGNIPYVISLRGLDIPGLQNDRNKKLSALTSALNKSITRNAKAVICNSSESAIVYNKFVPDIPISIIPNAIDIEADGKSAYSDKITKFITVGRLIPWKRIDLLIDAVCALQKRHHGIILDIYGQGYQFEILQKHISANQADGFINLKGHINKAQLTEALHEYDLFIFASTGDSCPNVLIEAMASGLPVVAAKHGGAIDIVEDGVTGLFTAPGDLEDTIEKLEYCINSPEKMKEFGINGRKRVEEYHSILKTAQEHVYLYERSLAQSDT